MKGKFVIIIGPSAVGKTTLVEVLLKRIPQSKRITTITTRMPREGEIEGEDFFFVTRKQFESMRDSELLIEWSEHFENYYGTSKQYLEQLLNTHLIVFAVLDINGARMVLEREPRTLTIFLEPGDCADLKKRLEERGIGSQKERDLRLERASTEIKSASHFHYRVINIDGKFRDTIQTTQDIIMNEVELLSEVRPRS